MIRRFVILLISLLFVSHLNSESFTLLNGEKPVFFAEPAYVNLVKTPDNRMHLLDLVGDKLRIRASSNGAKTFIEESFDTKGLDLQEISNLELHRYFGTSWLFTFKARTGGKEGVYALGPTKAGLALVSALSLNQNPASEQKLFFTKTLNTGRGEFFTVSLSENEVLRSLWTPRDGILRQETSDREVSAVSGARLFSLEKGELTKTALLSWGFQDSGRLDLSLYFFDGTRLAGTWRGEEEGWAKNKPFTVKGESKGPGLFGLVLRQEEKLTYFEWAGAELKVDQKTELPFKGGFAFFSGPW